MDEFISLFAVPASVFPVGVEVKIPRFSQTISSGAQPNMGIF